MNIVKVSSWPYFFKEWEWSVLQYVLKTLPDQLRNKTLVLGGGSDVTRLCAFLCSMVSV